MGNEVMLHSGKQAFVERTAGTFLKTTAGRLN